MRIAIIAAAFGLALAGCASHQAAEAPTQGKPRAVAAKAGDDGKVCVREMTTGSTIAKRVCRTQAEIDAKAAADREKARAMETAARQATAPQ